MATLLLPQMPAHIAQGGAAIGGIGGTCSWSLRSPIHTPVASTELTGSWGLRGQFLTDGLSSTNMSQLQPVASRRKRLQTQVPVSDGYAAQYPPMVDGTGSLSPKMQHSFVVPDGTGSMSPTLQRNATVQSLSIGDGTQSLSPRLQRPSVLNDGTRSCTDFRSSLHKRQPLIELQETIQEETSNAAAAAVPQDMDTCQTWALGDNFRHRRRLSIETHGVLSVVAPGGGTGFNAPVYAALGKSSNMRVEIMGQSRAPYDRYPPAFPDGAPAPNLSSFATDLISQGIIEKSACLVLGSRGGQVVLPALWRARGVDVPPAVVMNGGCAMKLPETVLWPENAVTFLLLGGQDYFKGKLSAGQYIADARSRVPAANSTTAILLVNEMVHMPQTELLMAIMQSMITIVCSWKGSARVVRSELDSILKALVALGMSGQLHYTVAAGTWEEFGFGKQGVVRI